MKNEFSRFHPAVNFLYFSAVLLFSMFLMNPVCIFISLICSLSYCIRLRGVKALRGFFLALLPVMLTASVLNPLFNHEGATILAYFPSGNPLTLESIIFGGAAAGVIGCVLLWFSCFSEIMTADKFMYLFSRIIPSLSLVLSMTMRFVPRLLSHTKEVSAARTRIGLGVSAGSVKQRIKHGISILSSIVTWSFENSIDTADSMRSRGYGLRGRTAFSVYSISRRDIYTLIAIFAFSFSLLAGIILNSIHFSYFPKITVISCTPYAVLTYAAYFFLCLLPMIIEITEDIKWRISESKI